MTNEQIISDFLKTAYSDEKLAMLLAHAEDGKLFYQSCCCLIGIPTADHALRGEMPEMGSPGKEPHYLIAKALPGAKLAESAFLDIAWDPETCKRDFGKVIPLVRSEMERRAALKTEPELEYQMVTK